MTLLVVKFIDGEVQYVFTDIQAHLIMSVACFSRKPDFTVAIKQEQTVLEPYEHSLYMTQTKLETKEKKQNVQREEEAAIKSKQE